MAEMLAAVSSQNQKLQNLILSDNESGSTNKVPRLMDLSDYAHSKGRFENHLNGVDTNLWERILSPYERPVIPNTNGISLALDRFDTDQRKKFDAEKKAYWYLTQAIPRDIYHQFSDNKTCYSLWRALEERVEGNDKIRKMKAFDIKKEFENFHCVGNESLKSMITRFHHLLAEARNFGIEFTEDEKIDCFAEAIPNKWNSFVMVLRENLPGMTLSEFLQKLEEVELKEKRKERRSNAVQDPQLYGATINTSETNSSSKLQTAFISNTVENNAPSTPTISYSSNSTPTKVENSSGSSSSPVKLNTLNFGKVTVEIAEEHLAMVACVINAFDEQIAGNIGNSNLTFEDYSQIDPDEMELIDTQWAFASAMRRAKNWSKKTGKPFRFNKDTKFGFDINIIQCYNCGELGHFARDCNNPKKAGNINPFKTKNRDTKNEKSEKDKKEIKETPSALTSQADEGFDWNDLHDKFLGAYMVSSDHKSKKVESVCSEDDSVTTESDES